MIFLLEKKEEKKKERKASAILIGAWQVLVDQDRKVMYGKRGRGGEN